MSQIGKGKVFGTTIQSEAGVAFLTEALDIVTKNLAEREGIYRFSPNLSELLVIQQKINKGESVDLHTLEPNILAGLVKCYFRELEPEPIIPFDCYESLIAAVQEEQYKILVMGVLDEVSYENIAILAKLCHHLYYVSTKSDKNKMPPDNLSIVWAQNLLKPRVETPATILGDVLYVNDLVGKLITEVDYFFSEQVMQRRKAEWELVKNNPDALKKKEEEKKEKKRKKKEKEEKNAELKLDGNTYEVKYRPPKSLTYKQMKLNVSYEGGIKLLDGKTAEVKEQYTIEQLRWVSTPVHDTVSIDLGSNRTLNNGFLIVKTQKAKEIESLLSEYRSQFKAEEVQRRMAPVSRDVKWDSEEEVRRRKDNKRKINEEWMIDFVAKKPTELDMDDRKQLRKSLMVRYAIKKKDNPVRAAIQEMQMKDDKMADFFGRMVLKVKSGNYSLQQLDAWLKWIGGRIFGKGGANDIPKELLELEDECPYTVNEPGTNPIKEGGGSGILMSPRGPAVTPEQLRRGRPMGLSAPVLPTGRSVIIRPGGGSGIQLPTSPSPPSGSPPQFPAGRSVIVKQRSFDAKSQYTPASNNHNTSPHNNHNTHNSNNDEHTDDSGDESTNSDDSSQGSPKPGRAKGFTSSVTPSPPVPARNTRLGIVSSYPSSQPSKENGTTTTTTTVSKGPPPVPHRDRHKPGGGSGIGASTPLDTTTTTSSTTGISAALLAEGKNNYSALTNGRSVFIPRNRNVPPPTTTQQQSPPQPKENGTATTKTVTKGPPPSPRKTSATTTTPTTGLTAIPQGSKSVRPVAPPRNPNLKLSNN